ncbi:MAG TPA: isoprenyl transferase [Candidatus Butyricicoccus avicola]|nr:isoprenyl transferase [Candidatus Butyricicoccus avicola]
MGIFDRLTGRGPRASGEERKDRPVPRHIAVIMDGNGRWAKKRGLPRKAGHKVGAETFRTIATYCKDIGVKYFTVYAFSTENWKRPQDEVDALMNLFRTYLKEAAETMVARGVAVRVLGDLSVLPADIQRQIDEVHALADTLGEDAATASLCINYGGRDEIKNAVRALAHDVQAGRLRPEDITEDTISAHLYTAHMPDPDLIIRPSGEVRTSNFLLWQSAYSEYYFTDVLWPDFSTKDMDAAIDDFNRRSRRFGGV